jgi:signal peptide peptidase SppA
MKYANIMMACAAEPWALEKTKLITVANFLRFKALGGKYSQEEVAARIHHKTEASVRQADGSVGVLPIHGVIGERMNMLDDISGGTSTELISKQFRAMLNDNTVKAIVFDINSPGGVARSVEELAQEIYDARGIKPMVAQVNTCAASAAYWIATQADEVVVTPSGQAGSIGVYAIHEDISQMLEMEGIKETLVYAGEFKVLGNEFEPLSAAAKTIMQQRVDELAVSFTGGVARGRGVAVSTVNDSFGQGLMFGASDLVKRGMADRVAPVADTLARFGIDVNPALARSRADKLNPAAQASGTTPLTRLADWGRRVNDGDVPPPQDFEEFLRDVGISKSQRARIASRMHAVLRSESGSEEEAKPTVESALAELRKRIDGFTIPKL